MQMIWLNKQNGRLSIGDPVGHVTEMKLSASRGDLPVMEHFS